MSYRSSDNAERAEESSSSDEEFSLSPCHKAPRFDTDTKDAKGSKSGQMWAAFLMEQGLTERLSTRAGIRGKNVDRGVESYEVPEEELYDGKNDIDDSEKHTRRKFPKEEHPLMRKGSFNKNKRLGKRSYNKRNESLVSQSYSLEALMNTEFPEGMPLDDLASEIAEALGERGESIIPSVVKELGEDRALKLFNEVRDIEATGGMKVLDGSRRRTPGGVYMVLFKSDPDVSQEIKRNIMKLTKTTERSTKKAKRKNKTVHNEQPEDKCLPSVTDVLLKKQTNEENKVNVSQDSLMETET